MNPLSDTVKCGRRKGRCSCSCEYFENAPNRLSRMSRSGSTETGSLPISFRPMLCENFHLWRSPSGHTSLWEGSCLHT